MRLQTAVLSLFLGLLAPAAAHATPINPDVTFSITNGGVANSPYGGGSLSGTVTINTVTGTFVSEYITASVFVPDWGKTVKYVFSGQGGGQELFNGTYGGEISGANGLGALVFYLPVTSLVGYDGGSICTTNNICPGYNYSDLFTGDPVEIDNPVFSGTLTPLSPTPEPSSLVLLATGVVGVAAAARRRFRRS